MQGYTYSRRPVELVWSESFSERDAAREAERIVKDWSRKKKEALIAGDDALRLFFARKPSERSDAAKARLFERQREAAAIRAQFPTRSFEREREPARLSSSAGFSLALEQSGGEAAPRFSLTLEQSADTASPPAIVLVRPQLAENIGKAARAMLNFGLTDLRLVAPRDGWPNPDAGPAASGADSVIRDARLFATLAEAVADCGHVYATTVRKRGVVKPVVDAAEAATAIVGAPYRSAVVFGPERSGLDTDDVALARTILTVPINPEFGSLNLAQAVILVAYEWSKHEALVQPPATIIDPPAPHDELEQLVCQFDDALDAAGFYYPPSKVPTTKRLVRSILTKPGWSAPEVRTLRGIVAALVNPRPKS